MSSQPTNLCAPDLPLSLSPDACERVAQVRSSGGSPFATPDGAALRRDPARDLPSVLRPAFVRDAEKIVHMPAYNRMSGKTQVFSFRANDDLCRRGLHVQLVARVARDIGRALGLNLDETEDLLLTAGIALSGSSKFDIIVAYCIEHHITDINEINCLLFDFDQPTLGA